MKPSDLKVLQSLLLGSVTRNADALEHFSTDQSIFQADPAGVAYPQNTADVRKLVKFAAEKAAAGKSVSLTPRGKGSDQGGAATGEGLHVVFPAHMNKLLRLDNGTVTVQPGILFETLQQALYTHGRFIAQSPAGGHYATIGGLVASDTGGQNSLKYGNIRACVRKLKVVLADGSLIETGRLSAREWARKKGLDTLEGEIYRAVDGLLEDNAGLIAARKFEDVPNTAGYHLWDIKGPGHTFDLTQLFIGSQGTLGMITEITLVHQPYNPRTTLLVGCFDNVSRAAESIVHLQTLGPSAIEIVDRHLLEFHRDAHPTDLLGLIPDKIPAIVVFVEFDNYSQFAQKLRSTRAARIMRRHSGSVRISSDPVEQVALWKIRRASVAGWVAASSPKALPFIEDAAVPLDKLPRLIDRAYKLLKKHGLEAALWGHAGSGNIRLHPRLNLAKHADVTKLLILHHEYTELVISLGGTISATHGDSLLRATELSDLYGADFFKLLVDIKHIFDPHHIFNPHLKTGATVEYARAHLRPEFSTRHLHDFSIFT